MGYDSFGKCTVSIPVIIAFGKLRQEDCEFEVSLSYIVRAYKRKKNQ